MRHPVVGVGVEDAAVQRGRPDPQPVLGLGDVAAEPRRARWPAPPAGRSRGRGCGRSRAAATGVSARAHSAATAGVSSPTSCRSSSMPWMLAGAGHGQPVVVELDRRRPCSARISRSASPAWVVRRGQSGHRHRAAGDQCRGQERRGVGQVRLDRHVDGADRRRARPCQRSASESSTSTPCSRSWSTVISMCGSEGTGWPVVPHVDALVVPGAGEQQRRDELARRRGVDGHRAAADPARARPR